MIPGARLALRLHAHLGRLLLLDEVESGLPDDGEVLRTVSHSGTSSVFVEGHAEDPVEVMSEGPVRAAAIGEPLDIRLGHAAQVIHCAASKAPC